MRRSYSFIIPGLEPSSDPAWSHATPSARAAYFRVARELVLIAFDKQMAAGLDRDGDPFYPLRPRTIRYRRSAMGPADPRAPALTPAHALSRTRSLVDARVEGSSIRVFWRFDSHSAAGWGRILDYHRRGAGRLPVRDVFGLAPEGLASVKEQGLHWWRAFAAGLPVRAPIRPAPGRAARPVVATIPEYVPKDKALHGARKSTTHQLAIGESIYTLGSGTSAEIHAAIKSGTFSGFRKQTSEEKAAIKARFAARYGPKPAAAKPAPRPVAPPKPAAGPAPKPAPVAMPAGLPRAAGEPIPARARPFPDLVHRAAHAVPESLLYSETKAWIHHVWEEYRRMPGAEALTLDEFKRLLVETLETRVLLMRADIAVISHPLETALAEVEYLEGVAFHLVKRRPS